MTSGRFARWPLPGVVLAVVLAGQLVLGTTSAWPVTPPLPVADGPGIVEGQPSPEQVIEARERLRALRTGEQQQAAGLAGAVAALEAAAAESALALETYRAAADLRREALTELSRRETALVEAETAIGQERAQLARWAREAYVDGGSLGMSPLVYTLLAGGSTDDVATHRTWMQRAGRNRSQALARLRVSLERRQAAMDSAAHAATVAEASAGQAEAALAARDAVLVEHRRRVADLRLALAGTRRAADDAQATADLAAAQLAAGGSAGRPAGSAWSVGSDGGGNRVTGPVGDCPGRDVSTYPNGRIPLDALCPLDGPAGGLLRADAAYAFNRLSAAYAGRFGQPMCVTDSYRSYDEQVRVRAARPGFAAVPGRSNHGWGTAVDLCGGVERFDSAEHAWLRLNAPLFGWFHPAWAGRAGSLPEPWHWEFSG